MAHKTLIKGIIAQLQLDATLVELTGHASSSIRIARDRPPVKGRLPFLGVAIFVSSPLLSPEVTHLKRTRLHFKCYAAEETVATELADQVDLLIDNKGGEVNSYYDFSTTDLSIREHIWIFRREPTFDEEIEVWEVLVESDVIWVGETCP